VDQIFDRLNAKVAEALLNDGIAGEWDALAVNLSESTFVDEFLDGFHIWVSPGDVWQDCGITISVKLDNFFKTLISLSVSKECNTPGALSYQTHIKLSVLR